MKKKLSLLLAFLIVWVLSAFMCYLLNLIFDREGVTNVWQEYAIIGFAGALAGLFGPILAVRIGKIFKKR